MCTSPQTIRLLESPPEGPMPEDRAEQPDFTSASPDHRAKRSRRLFRTLLLRDPRVPPARPLSRAIALSRHAPHNRYRCGSRVVAEPFRDALIRRPSPGCRRDHRGDPTLTIIVLARTKSSPIMSFLLASNILSAPNLYVYRVTKGSPRRNSGRQARGRTEVVRGEFSDENGAEAA